MHHSGRNGNARGTSKREDLLDTVIALRHPPSYRAEEGLRAELHFEKARHFFGKDAQPFEIELTLGANGVPAWNIKDIEASGFEKAAKLLEEGCNIPAVIEELGISRATAFRYKNKWKQSQRQKADETNHMPEN